MTALSSIGGVAALIFVGSYLAGRQLGSHDDERGRVAVTAPPAASSSAEPTPRGSRVAPEPTSDDASFERAAIEPTSAEPDSGSGAGAADDGPFADFDLELLHPNVLEAVRAARAVRAGAQAAALRADAAARRARAGAQGTGVITYESGDAYEGEVVDGRRQGVGVYTWANPQEDAYQGEFRDDVVDGLGVKRWADGATYYGDRRLEAREGYGVFVYADGGGYEGAWRGGAPDGHGVVWNADGSVRAQGLWAGNTLVEAWIVPKPVAADEGGEEEDVALTAER